MIRQPSAPGPSSAYAVAPSQISKPSSSSAVISATPALRKHSGHWLDQSNVTLPYTATGGTLMGELMSRSDRDRSRGAWGMKIVTRRNCGAGRLVRGLNGSNPGRVKNRRRSIMSKAYPRFHYQTTPGNL